MQQIVMQPSVPQMQQMQYPQIIIQQIQQPEKLKIKQNNFQSGLCNICSMGCCVCFQGFFCTSGLVSETKSRFDGSSSWFNKLCVSHASVRNTIRRGYKIKGNCGGDICSSTFCKPCSAIQMANEVHVRGAPNRQMM